MGLIDGLFEEGLAGLGSTMLLGVGAVLAAPVVLPAVMGGVRPLVKTAVKGYVYLSDSLRESLAEAGEQFNDIVEEVRSEATTTTDQASHPESGRIVTPSGGAQADTESRKGRPKEH